ncbi:MAG: PEGA domain-containing protein [Lentisphaeria bacterium]|nr:PEGA domain-containing protein [Lentisphaeria bacterium]MDY0176315.1 PEGA domain-containing protein [Lentisphaeria bacterium]
MRLRILKGAEPGKVITLTDLVFTIGRDPGNEFVINESGVSRHHCSIRSEAGLWQIEDCNSVNGVLLNDERISGKAVLRPGDRITVFNHEFLFLEDKEEAPVSLSYPEAPSAVPRTSIPWGKLIFLIIILALVVYLAIKVFAPEAKSPSSTATVQISESAEPESFDLPVPEAEPFGTAQSQGGSYSGTQSASPPYGGAAPAAAAQSLGEGLLLLESEPPGAEVYVDGQRQDATTPLILRQLAHGRHTVELRKAGYENSERIVQIPDRLASRPIVLQQKAGTLLLSSEPSGAHVWHERQLLGVTPVLIEGLAPGSYKLTVRGPGCESKKIEVLISNARAEKMELSLQSNLGNLEIITQPANCEVFLQDAFMGSSLPQPGKGESQPLLLRNVIAGEQNLRVRHSSGISSRGRVLVPRGDTLRRKISLRIPTHRVELHNAEVFNGTLLEQNQAGDVVLEDMSGRAERFLKPQIKSMRELSDQEIQELAGDKREAGSEPQSVAELERSMQSMSQEDFNRNHVGKTYSLQGRPGMILGDGRGTSTVIFSTKVRAQFQDLSKDEINVMNAPSKGRVVFKATVQGVDREGVLTLKNCQLLDEF